MLGRWLPTSPRLLILDEPTAGVDIEAKSTIHRRVDELARAGVGVLLISSDLPELMTLADRLVIMRDGRLTGSLERGPAWTEEEIALLGGEIARPVPGGVLEQDGGGDADIEALGEAAHGDAYAVAAGGAELGGDAGALVAEDQRQPGDRGEIVREEVALGVGGDELVAGGGERGDGLGDRRVGADVNPALRAAGDGAVGCRPVSRRCARWPAYGDASRPRGGVGSRRRLAA